MTGLSPTGPGSLSTWSNTDHLSLICGKGTPDYYSFMAKKKLNYLEKRRHGASPLQNARKEDCKDADTTNLRPAKGLAYLLLLHTSTGSFTNVEAGSNDDPTIPRSGKSSIHFPHGATTFQVAALSPEGFD